MDQRHKPGMVLLSGNSHPGLAEEVARDGQHAIFSTFLYETGIGNVLAEDKDHFTVFVPTDR